MADSRDLQLYTVEQVATLCKVSVKTVYRAIWQGRLRASQLGVGAAYRVRLEDIQDWIEASAVRTESPQKERRRLHVKVTRHRPTEPTTGSTEGRLFAPEEMDGSA